MTVSIVEDLEDIRDALRVLINGSVGFECVHVYADAEEALDKMPDKDINVVLMDINLPGMDGIDCMKALKPAMPDAQFMMCTVYDDDDHIFNALQSGASGYILKRTSPSQILEAICDLYEGGSPMSSEIARRVVRSMHNGGKTTETVELLTDRESEILDFLAKGYLYKEIASGMNVYNGNVILDANGEAVVQMEAWFEPLNRDFRYQLTCIGGFAPVYIAEKISNNQFRIAGGTPGLEVSWQVTGIRQDPYANQNRIEVEVEKPAEFKGYYFHPEAYGRSFESGFDYVKNGYKTLEELNAESETGTRRSGKSQD